MKRWILIVAAMAMAALATNSGQAQSVGVTPTEIHIGNTMAYSGPVSSAGTRTGQVLTALVDSVNAAGGINGRKIILHSLDDGYSPPKTVEQTRKLVEGTGVMMMFHQFGTPTSAAVQVYLNRLKVPQLFVSSGGTRFNDGQKYPWSSPTLPDYFEEGAAYGKYLASLPDGQKIGVLYQNDDFGKDLVAGLKKGLGDRSKAIVAEISYEPTEPTVVSQVSRLQSQGANVFVNFAAGKATVQAIVQAYISGWKPIQVVTSAWAGIVDVFEQAGLEKATGIITGQYLKDPGDPAWDNDPAMNEYRDFVRKNVPRFNPRERPGITVYSTAKVFFKLLEGLGDNLTREAVMEAAIKMKNVQLDTLVPGGVINTSPGQRNLFQILKVVQFDGKTWKSLQDVTPLQ